MDTKHVRNYGEYHGMQLPDYKHIDLKNRIRRIVNPSPVRRGNKPEYSACRFVANLSQVEYVTNY